MQLVPVGDTSLIERSLVEKGFSTVDELKELGSEENLTLVHSEKRKALQELTTESGRIKAYHQHHGRVVWTSINKVVFLTQIKRQESDPQWAGILGRIREGKINDHDISILNSRLMDRTPNPSGYQPIIVLRNDLRHELNQRMIFSFAAERDQQVLAIRSHDVVAGHIPAHLDRIRKYGPDNLFQGLPHILYVTKGAPICITKNHAVELGLTNGATALVSEVVMSERDQIDSEAAFIDDPRKPYFLKDFPEYITLDMRDEGTRVRHQPVAGLKEFELAVFPVTATLNVTSSKFGHTEKKGFKRTSFQLTLAFALTDYKVQGKSYFQAIVDLVKPAKARESINSLYVMLSRVKSLSGLRILQAFNADDVKAKLPESYVTEMRRLKSLVVQ